jgi:hypothetical protein
VEVGKACPALGENVDRPSAESRRRLDPIETKHASLGPQLAPSDPDVRLDRDLIGWLFTHLDWLDRVA